MKVFIISFMTNPRIVAKFQNDRFRTFDKNRAGKKNKEITLSKPYSLVAKQMRRCQSVKCICALYVGIWLDHELAVVAYRLK